MYGIFEITVASKRRVFDGAAFASIPEALASIEAITVFADADEANDAADVFTKTGAVYAVERV